MTIYRLEVKKDDHWERMGQMYEGLTREAAEARKEIAHRIFRREYRVVAQDWTHGPGQEPEEFNF